jgi:hypothetical protein
MMAFRMVVRFLPGRTEILARRGHQAICAVPAE